MSEAPRKMYWFAVYETVLPVMRDGEETGQHVNQKWTREGDVTVAPGETTAQLVGKMKQVGTEDPEIPPGALLVDFKLLPFVPVPQ